MTGPLPEVNIVVTVIHRGEHILLVSNPNWKAFTLPMTKLRLWSYGAESAPGRVEDPVDAAMRNVGECLGATSIKEPLRLLGGDTVVELTQSDSDGISKRYVFCVYGFATESLGLAPGVCGQWLSVDEIQDPLRRPVSPTARFVIRHLAAHAKL